MNWKHCSSAYWLRKPCTRCTQKYFLNQWDRIPFQELSYLSQPQYVIFLEDFHTIFASLVIRISDSPTHMTASFRSVVRVDFAFWSTAEPTNCLSDSTSESASCHRAMLLETTAIWIKLARSRNRFKNWAQGLPHRTWRHRDNEDPHVPWLNTSLNKIPYSLRKLTLPYPSPSSPKKLEGSAPRHPSLPHQDNVQYAVSKVKHLEGSKVEATNKLSQQTTCWASFHCGRSIHCVKPPTTNPPWE